ncbi:MAG: hypothetical protein ACM3JJ_12760 [Hyphomicrobiales bacterium]
MSAPRTRQDPPLEAPARATPPTALLEAPRPEPADRLREAELAQVIESVASRLLGFALAREGEESEDQIE